MTGVQKDCDAVRGLAKRTWISRCQRAGKPGDALIQLLLISSHPRLAPARGLLLKGLRGGLLFI
jgi:hypothetical protein